MKRAGLRFRVIPSNASERAPRGLGAAELVTRLALEKAMTIARRHPTHVVLGADTLVFLNGRAIGKPGSRNHARRMLKQLSGRWQRVYTGMAVVKDGGKWKRTAAAISSVKLRALSEADVERASAKHLDKAGAYAIQEKKDPFVEKIRGDRDNVEGLSMRVVRRLLRAAR
jgi:septum formation protein